MRSFPGVSLCEEREHVSDVLVVAIVMAFSMLEVPNTDTMCETRVIWGDRATQASPPPPLQDRRVFFRLCALFSEHLLGIDNLGQPLLAWLQALHRSMIEHAELLHTDM